LLLARQVPASENSAMTRGLTTVAALAWLISLPPPQPDIDRVYQAFSARLDTYVQMHRRIEGPVPPLAASEDFAEVRRFMHEVRRRIKAEGKSEQGRYFTPDLTLALHTRIASVMTREDVQALVDDVIEHTPPRLHAIRIYEPLPNEAPFVPIPPRLFPVLPTLPPELRYVVLGKGLVLWDHHADLVIDHAPGLFDPKAFRTQSEN
jgi:hypothetical protein